MAISLLNNTIADRIYWQDPKYCARLAVSESDKNAIFALRYQSYFVERQIPLVYADHDLQRLEEPLDDHSVQMGVYNAEGQTLATMRITFSKDFPEHEIPYHPSYFQYPLIPRTGSYALVTKLAVDSRYRGSPLALGVCKGSLRYIYELGAEVIFIDVGQFIVRFMTRLGFKPYVGQVNHPEFGPSIPMYLRLNDLEHLRRVNSPFVAIAEHYLVEELIDEV